MSSNNNNVGTSSISKMAGTSARCHLTKPPMLNDTGWCEQYQPYTRPYLHGPGYVTTQQLGSIWGGGLHSLSRNLAAGVGQAMIIFSSLSRDYASAGD